MVGSEARRTAENLARLGRLAREPLSRRARRLIIVHALAGRYMFVSNSDNLGATMDLKLLTWFAQCKAPFAMECARRTDADKKGGHLASAGDKYLLRESAQCPDADEKAFQDVTKHSEPYRMRAASKRGERPSRASPLTRLTSRSQARSHARSPCLASGRVFQHQQPLGGPPGFEGRLRQVRGLAAAARDQEWKDGRSA